MASPSPTPRRLDVLRLGQRPYGEVHQLQRELVEKRIAGEIPDTLILTEHPGVITVGRGGELAALAATGVPVVEVERGGDATYHGPGQVVAYPILALGEGRRDLHRYLRDLEEVVLRMLAEVQIEGRRREGFTGVWIGDRKVCSIGVAVRRWVTWHGFALNVHTEPLDLAGFRPCGLDPGVMTRAADHAELPPANLLFEVLAVKHVLEVFDLELPPPPAPPAPADGAYPELPLFPA